MVDISLASNEVSKNFKNRQTFVHLLVDCLQPVICP